MSPLRSWVIQLIPRENKRLTGPILLNNAMSNEISNISPVLVPRYAKESEWSITMQVNLRFIWPRFTA
jgi:hypothetical protein